MTLQQKLDEMDRAIRSYSLPPHVAKTIQAGIDAQAEHERQLAKLKAERTAIAEAMKQQVGLDEFEKRRAEAEREAQATAAAQAALRTQVDMYLDLYDDICTNLRRAAAATAAAMDAMAGVGKLAGSLGNGRVPDTCSPMQLQTDLSQLWLALLKEGLPPAFRNRIGTIEFGSSISARHPLGTDHVEAERKRLARHILPLAQG
jgi:hypothetical protein